MGGGVVVEGQESLPVSDELVDRLGILVAELGDKDVDTGFSISAGFRFVDLMQRCLSRLV